mmetsp:Transcript_16780/g.41312  ORF Transcript_16780/g.41312 Transcript_16780/m.41312 type:complete len:102 (-) Transcript_16780:231-536(-)
MVIRFDQAFRLVHSTKELGLAVSEQPANGITPKETKWACSPGRGCNREGCNKIKSSTSNNMINSMKFNSMNPNSMNSKPHMAATSMTGMILRMLWEWKGAA